MAIFYTAEQFNELGEQSKICFSEVQLRVLQYVIASQLCRMKEPLHGSLILEGLPENGMSDWIMRANLRYGDFMRQGITGFERAQQSIDAAAYFPDVDLHYSEMAPSNEPLQSGIYLDDELSVLVLLASRGKLFLALQLADTKDGAKYAQGKLLKAYAAAVFALHHLMPKDTILGDACVSAFNEISHRYMQCETCDNMLADLKWIKGVFERGEQPIIHQWRLWQQEYPEIKAYFK